MNPEQYELARELFLSARALPPGERAGFLEARRGEDEQLVNWVEELLANDDDASFLEQPAWAAPAPTTPERIGPYTIQGVLGEGGMSVVYRAEQDNPRREVALKVIKPGIASPGNLRRLEFEAQVLGRLHDPGIANVFEAGTATTDRGTLPFFAMELIEGRRVDEYVRDEGLGTRERLELFAEICDAVQHAHQKGVIHRDLKPGNILVEGSGQPKVLDFGVARATDGDVRTTTTHTGAGQLIGTIPYMSPEQVSGDPRALDTRSDVYALGILGYELLAGRLPYDVRQKTIPDAVGIIRDRDPMPLSAVDRAFRGDLETIFAKALEKDRERRYASAAALAADVRRHLRDEPIGARPASTAYQLAKFTRRNRVLVGGLLATAAALLLGTAVSTWLAIAATAERDRAKRAETAAVEAADDATEIRLLIEGILVSADPALQGRDVRVVDLLDDAALRVRTELADRPRIQAHLMSVIGQALHGLGHSERAEGLIGDALAIHRRLGLEGPETLRLTSSLGAARWATGGLDSAEALLRGALAGQRAALGDEHDDTLKTAANLGAVLHATGDLEAADELLCTTLEIRRRISGHGDPETLRVVTNLGALLLEAGERAEALALMRDALAVAEGVLGDDAAATLELAGNLVAAEIGGEPSRRPTELLEEAESVLERKRRVLGPTHRSTLGTSHLVGRMLAAAGRPDEAEAVLAETRALTRQHLDATHELSYACASDLAGLYARTGRLNAALPLLREAHALRRSVQGATHRDTIVEGNSLALVLTRLGESEEAEALYWQVLDDAVRSLAPGAPETFAVAINLTDLLRTDGRTEEALVVLRDVVDAGPEVSAETGWLRGAVEVRLGICLGSAGDHGAALIHLKVGLDVLREALGPGDPRTREALEAAIAVYEDMGKSDAADELRGLLDGR